MAVMLAPAREIGAARAAFAVLSPRSGKVVAMVPARSARRLDFLRVAESADGRVLDLADVRWLDPLHLVGIATLAHLAHQDGSRLVLTGVRRDQASYAARMRLGRIIDAYGGRHELPEVPEHDVQGSLLEIRPLREARDVEELSALVHTRVAATDLRAAHALHIALGEVGSNVCQHARGLGFMAAQTIAEHGVLRFAVADAGVGLRATLAGLGARDDRGALTLALTGRRRLHDPGHGYGLPSTVASITALDGELLLASGVAAMRIGRSAWRDRDLEVAFNGTIFEGSVPAGPPGGRPARRRVRHRGPADPVPNPGEVKQ
jgi:hypothetical protein